MNRPTMLAILAVLFAGLLGPSLATYAAPTSSPQPLPSCLSVNASQTRTLGPNTPSVEASALDHGYATVGCHRFVVDVNVPGTSSGGSGYVRSFSFAGFALAYGGNGLAGGDDPVDGPRLDKQADCESYRREIRVYKWNVLTHTWVLQEGGVFVGQWSPPPADPQHEFYFPCVPRLTSGTAMNKSFNPPANSQATDRYRVVLGVKAIGYWRAVRVRASHNQAPPR